MKDQFIVVTKDSYEFAMQPVQSSVTAKLLYDASLSQQSSQNIASPHAGGSNAVRTVRSFWCKAILD